MGIFNKSYKLKKDFQIKLKKKALKEVRHIANILGSQFGAKEVILYGSLVEGKKFDFASDIDLAIKGLTNNYFRAYGYCLRMSNFNLDIKPYEDMPPNFRLKVDQEGRCLYAKK